MTDSRFPTAAYIAQSAEIYGDVRLAKGVSVWPKVVMRAEAAHIEVGAYSNIQDFVMIHFGSDSPSIIGSYCSITHHVTVHGAKVGDHCLIGINATLMDGAVIGDNCIVAGHSIVREGSIIPANSVVAGVPAKVVAQRNNGAANKLNALAYYENGLAYAKGNDRRWSEAEYQQRMAEYGAEVEAQFGTGKASTTQ